MPSHQSPRHAPQAALARVGTCGCARRSPARPTRPRLVVNRSTRHIHAQVVDDTAGHTLASASTLEADLRGPPTATRRRTPSQVGELVAERAKAAGIDAVVFDRGGNQYHGRIAALADGAREAGLEF